MDRVGNVEAASTSASAALFCARAALKLAARQRVDAETMCAHLRMLIEQLEKTVAAEAAERAS